MPAQAGRVGLMAWAYAQHRFAYTWTLDSEEWNDNIVAFANEMNGNLNEQNFASDDLLLDLMENDLTEFDVMARVFSEKVRVDPLGSTSAMTEVKMSTRWTAIDEGQPDPFVSRGGLCLIIINFQMHCSFSFTGTSGMNFAVEVDGHVMVDSLLGTGDQSNDFLDTAFGATVAGGEVEFDFGTSPSFRSDQEPKQVRCLVELDPGEHTVKLAVRNLFTVNDTAAQFISQIETIVIDCWGSR